MSSALGDPERRFGSRVLHAVDEFTARPVVAVAVIALDLIWVVVSNFVATTSRIQSIFQTLVAALTLALVFVLQHTQARQESVTQRKLDEVLRALPDADNSLLVLEEGSDPELSDAYHRHRAVRREATTEANR